MTDVAMTSAPPPSRPDTLEGLGFVALAAEAGARIAPVLDAIAKTARAGDWVICIDDGRDPNTLVAIALYDQMNGMPAGVVVRTLSTDATLPVADDWFALTCEMLRGMRLPLPRHLVFLSGTGSPSPAALGRLRRDVVALDADLVALVPAPEATARAAVTEPVSPRNGICSSEKPVAPVLVRHAIRTSILIGADAPTRELNLLWSAGAAKPDLPRLEVGSTLLAKVPEAGPRLGEDLAALLHLAPQAREWLSSSLLARLATTRAGARALLRPRIEALDLPMPPPLAAPATGGRARLRVLLTGPHAHRTPLAWPALAPLWQERFAMTQDSDLADLVVIGHPLDAISLPAHAADALARRDRPLTLLSEEPFWDSLFSPDPAAESVILPVAHIGEARAWQINHHRARTFDFDRIPYYLLTDHSYWPAYASRFARGARRSAKDWHDSFAARAQSVVFMAERRPERFHDVEKPEAGMIGLCAWRTRLAERCAAAERRGASWQGGPSRFDLKDWHFDKLAQLDEMTRDLSALENTHQPTYVSEKLFDAFACGARPLYMAGSGAPGAGSRSPRRELAEPVGHGRSDSHSRHCRAIAA